MGFTLTEVIITLGIIGVVAAMTIVTLVKNTQDTELDAKVKKSYNNLVNVYNQAIHDNGGDLGNYSCSSTFYKFNKFKSYFSIVKECNGNSLGNCWAQNGVMPYMFGGCSIVGSLASQDSSHGFVLQDGTVFVAGACDYLLMDVNGPKPPNIWGQDAFSFEMDGTSLNSSIGGCRPGAVGLISLLIGQ